MPEAAAASNRLAVPPALDEARAPLVPMTALDTVWFQLTGTLCNIACRHCFISCGPKETRVSMMDADEVRRRLDEAEALGARDYYFTGGEPMLHPEFWPLVDEALRRGPLTVLTNGILIDADAAARARRSFDQARYSFDLRVSLDGMTAEENDPVRGRGTFAAITAGIAELARAGLSPAITVVEHQSGMAHDAARLAFLDFARSLGLAHPRVKFLPLLRIGREPRRTHGYGAEEVASLAGPHARARSPRRARLLLVAPGHQRRGHDLPHPARRAGGEAGPDAGRDAAPDSACAGPPARPVSSRGCRAGPEVGPEGLDLLPDVIARYAVFGGVYNNWLALLATLDDAARRGVRAAYCLGRPRRLRPAPRPRLPHPARALGHRHAGQLRPLNRPQSR